MSTELKPCPFCGETADFDDECDMAGCANTQCGFFDFWLPLESWNCRAPVSYPTARELGDVLVRHHILWSQHEVDCTFALHLDSAAKELRGEKRNTNQD